MTHHPDDCTYPASTEAPTFYCPRCKETTMERPTPEMIEEIRRCVASPDPGDEDTHLVCDEWCGDLLAEIDAQRELLAHLTTAHRTCQPGCDWYQRVEDERRRGRG